MLESGYGPRALQGQPCIVVRLRRSAQPLAVRLHRGSEKKKKKSLFHCPLPWPHYMSGDR